MKNIAMGLLVGVASLPVQALEVSESTVAKYVEMQLPKSIAGVQINAPKVTLLDGTATFCALARPKLFPKDFEFCTNLTPKWRQETGSLLGTNMSLVSLAADGISEKHLEMTKKIVNQSLLPALEGIEIYKLDNFIGRRITALKVKPSKLDLVF